MANQSKSLPFDGEISRFFNEDFPEDWREGIRHADKDDILNESYPFSKRLKRETYEDQLEALQIELVKLQSSLKESGERIIVIFEGRDAAGKGGTIKRFREFLNPRSARVVALAKPSDTERSQWYFQRYISHLPSAGEIVFFDRSWYNRGVIEHVFGFCNDEQRAQFFEQVNPFEAMLVGEGLKVFKIWLNVGRVEQMRRFIKRESDPLKQWKLSSIDVKGLSLWQAYSDAIDETLTRSHTSVAPWTIVRSDDKRRARLGAIQSVLNALDYNHKATSVASPPDPRIVGGPDLWHG